MLGKTTSFVQIGCFFRGINGGKCTQISYWVVTFENCYLKKNVRTDQPKFTEISPETYTTIFFSFVIVGLTVQKAEAVSATVHAQG